MPDEVKLVPHDIFTEDFPDGLLEDEGLVSIREKCERGLDVMTVFIPFRATDEPDVLCVVLENPSHDKDRFHCHRYMRKLGGGWEVSFDGQSVSYAQALKWITSPRAI